MHWLTKTSDKTRDTGILMIRLIVGLVFLYHGAEKLFGAFGGSGIGGFAKFLGNIHVPYPMVAAALSAGTEFFGGLALILGLFLRLAMIPMAFNMIVAVHATSGHGFSVVKGGFEYPLVMLVALAALAVTGPGRWSVDRLMAGNRSRF